MLHSPEPMNEFIEKACEIYHRTPQPCGASQVLSRRQQDMQAQLAACLDERSGPPWESVFETQRLRVDSEISSSRASCLIVRP